MMIGLSQGRRQGFNDSHRIIYSIATLILS